MAEERDPRNTWQTTSSKPIYDNPWISVREDQVINPGGGKGIYGVVSFKNLAIGIVPIDEEGYTYLVGQWRYTLNDYTWEIPEGGGKIGVDPLLSAQRELQEETGYSAQQWISLGNLHTSNSVTDEYGYAYLALALEAGNATPEETEDLRVKRVRFMDAVQMVMDNEITDALSIVGIMKAWFYCRKHGLSFALAE